MISFQDIEDLKSELTGKYVVVRPGLPELKRFEKLTGIIKTVNMNGRALVEFDGPVDIGWYDIDPGYLDIVAGPRPKATKTEEAPKAAAKPAPAASGKSPLEMARGGAAAAPAATGEKKASPLDLARQGAAKPAAAPVAGGGEKKLSPLEMARQGSSTTAAKPAAAPAGEKKLSPLELARQGSAKPAATPAAPPEAAPPEAAPAPAAEVPAATPSAAKAEKPADPPGMSKLELARQALKK